MQTDVSCYQITLTKRHDTAAAWCYTVHSADASCLGLVAGLENLRVIYSVSCNGEWTWKKREGNVLENIPFSTSALLVIGQA